MAKDYPVVHSTGYRQTTPALAGMVTRDAGANVRPPSEAREWTVPPQTMHGSPQPRVVGPRWPVNTWPNTAPSQEVNRGPWIVQPPNMTRGDVVRRTGYRGPLYPPSTYEARAER